jgi:putative ABC transport system permease protein
MKIFEAFRVAMGALAANKMRSILTMLGIIIGVGAVIALMSIGRGVEKYVTDQFAGLGSNLLFVLPGAISQEMTVNPAGIEPLTLSDADAIGDPLLVPDVAEVAPVYTSNAVISRNNVRLSAQVEATTPEFTVVRTWQPGVGEYFNEDDMQSRARVVALGSEVADKLFEDGTYPIDQNVDINGTVFRVIGIMETKGGQGMGGGSLDASIFVPLSTAQDRLFNNKTVSGDYPVSVIYAGVSAPELMDSAQEQITDLLRDRRNLRSLDSDDFSLISQDDIIGVFSSILGALTVFLGAIAGISLLVGGIGIMNIMLVSVTERTREIGLRKAVGAKRRDVLTQFLVEAVALAVVGGTIGILLGVFGALAVGQAFDGFSAVVGTDAVLLSLFFSMAVGLFFGIYPAYRASRLNPIDALRYE